MDRNNEKFILCSISLLELTLKMDIVGNSKISGGGAKKIAFIPEFI